MTLYRMELYRILHRKLFWVMGVVILGWLAVYFCLESVGAEITKVNGTVYEGYAAIRMDRKITEDFKGKLTDADVQRIIEKYGYPGEVREEYGHWMDENYLNGFVADNLTDGYFRSWDDYKVPQNTIPINESGLRVYSATPQGELNFAYARGWEKFLDIFQMSNWLLSLIVMICTAPLFCEERQSGMRQIMFTAEKGIGTDTRARIAAAFTVTVCGYIFLLLLLFGLCAAVFGFDGSEMSMGMGMILGTNSAHAVSQLEIGDFTLGYIVTALGGILMLTGMVVWISAKADTVAHSLLAAIFSWAAPVILYMTFQSRFLYLLALIQPALMSNYGSMLDAVPFYWMRAAAVPVVITAGIVCGALQWKKVD
ncbi:MAG: hypothetical protein Q4D16_08050 [Eubacteriales bacterium]|nr:hypothetical protein [Eubacteriales bacterium]